MGPLGWLLVFSVVFYILVLKTYGHHKKFTKDEIVEILLIDRHRLQQTNESGKRKNVDITDVTRVFQHIYFP